MSRLRTRLLLSHLAVAAVGAAVSIGVVMWQAPALFERGLGPQGGRSLERGGLRSLFQQALWQALLVGSIAALLVALLAAVVVSVRMLRSLEEVRRATRTISDGDYGAEIALPRETELAGLAEDVNRLASRLRDTETRRVRLLGEVAHEMRTPLTVLTGRVEGLRDGIFVADPALLDGMSDELRRLQRLADDLGTLSRVEEGRLELQRSRIDLVELASRILQRYEGDRRAGEVDLGLVADGEAWVEGDAQRLGQVIDNLLINALNAVSGSGKVTVEISRGATGAQLAVADDGRGIAPDDLERIFERFYRGVTAGGVEGSGIGLTVSRGIARAHGGDLVAYSSGLGQGARFALTLPEVATQRP